MTITDTKGTKLNTYQGGVYQQTSSGVAITNQDCYEVDSNGGTDGCFAVYAYEYKEGAGGCTFLTAAGMRSATRLS